MPHGNQNMPTFTASSYTTNTSNVGSLVGGSLTTGGSTGGGWSGQLGGLRQGAEAFEVYRQSFLNPPSKEVAMSAPVQIKSKLRIVRVFLVDPDDRVPVAKRVLHRSDEMTTDATDQELYFDIPVNDLLKKHNAERAEVEWEEKTTEGTKTRKGLKEARIRDLVMSVTTVAQF